MCAWCASEMGKRDTYSLRIEARRLDASVRSAAVAVSEICYRCARSLVLLRGSAESLEVANAIRTSIVNIESRNGQQGVLGA